MKSRNGFTIVEIMTVTVIIAVLATFVTVSMNRQQIQARDAERSTKATLIASALERYYDDHGEYPSPRALLNTYGGNTGTVVATLLGITDKDVLVMPEATTGTTNSIAPALSTADVVAYVAQSATSNDDCQTNIAGGCDKFTLSYKKEIDGSTVTINSTYQGRPGDYVTPLQAPSKPTLAVVQSGTNLVATSSVPTCSSDPVMTPKYSFREQVGAGAWSAWTSWQAGNTYARGSNTNAVSYTFQVQVRCEAGTTISDTSAASDPQSVTYYTLPTAPSAPTTVSLSPAAGTIATSVTATASGASCNYGTLQYLIDYRIDDGTWIAGTWGTGTTRTANSNQGDKYGFRATARCINGTQTLAGSVGAEVTVITGVQAPAAPTVSGTGPTWSWTPSACVTGSSPYYQYQFSYWTGSGWAAGGSWTWTSATTITNPAATSQGVAYGINVQEYCYSGYTNSAYSSAANGGTFVVPVVHVKVQYAALKLLTGGYPSIKIKSFSGACASGLSRYTTIGADYGNTGTYTYRQMTNQSTGVVYPASTFAPAPDGVIYNITNEAVATSSYAEFEIGGHCQNDATGYGQDSGGYYTVLPLYNYGNLHKISSTQYNISCAPDGPTMYCAAGFDSGGSSGTTSTTAKACTVKDNSYSYINDTNTKWSDRFNFGADNVCWTT